MKIVQRYISLLMLFVLIVGIFAGCGSASGEHPQNLEDFAHAKIGVMTGSSQELIAKEKFPEAERVYFSRPADMVIAVEQGKIDGYLFGSPFLAATIWENANVKRMDEAVSHGDIAFAFPQNNTSDPLREQLNTFLEQAKQDGTIDHLKSKWLGRTEPTEHPDYMSLTGENGTIRLAAVAENKPLIYQYQNQCTGLEMELLTLFAEAYGYRFDVETVPFDSVIMGMSTGKYDMTSASLQITAEREESVNFSVPYMQFDVVMVVKDDTAGTVADDRQFKKTLSDFENATIGIMTGSSHDGTAKEIFPNAERVYFNTVADMVLATEQGKIDGYIEDLPFLFSVLWEGANVKRLEESIKQVNNGFAFPQNEESRALREQVNAFIAASKADGTIDALMAKWFVDAEPTDHPDYMSLSGENGTIRLAVVVENKPAVYLKDNLCTGFEMELLTRFGQQYGYTFEIEAVPFSSVIAGIATGKYDMAAASLNITPEREESVDFSDPYASFDVVMIVKGDGEQQIEKFSTLADLENATLGIVTGTSWDLIAQKEFPEAKRMYFTSTADVILALKQGKVDAFFADRTVFAGIAWENKTLTAIDEPVSSVSNALIFAKEDYDEALFAQINEFIALSKNNGTLDMLSEKWFGNTEPEEHPDYTKLTGENGTIRIAVGDSMKPSSYQRGSMYTGYEVDFLTMFAEAYGYKLDIQGMAFNALIPTVASGKCDIGACGITITPEREESVTFADPHFETYGVAVVLNEAKEDEAVLADFENATIGVLTGSVYDDFAKERFPNAKREYYNMISDMIVAVEQGKINGYLSENTYVTAAIWEGAKIQSIGEAIDHTQAGFIFQKGEKSAQLREQMNSFIRAAKENGVLDALNEKWFGQTEPTEKLDYNSLTGENGTIRIAVAPDLKPISYIKDGELTGYEMELLLLFAKEYGYKLDMSYMTFDAILPGVTTGKYDIGTGAVTITDERAQSLDFSESHLTVDVVMVAAADRDSAAVQTGFWADVKESFEKTFIREDRWKLIVEGIGVTMLISICSVIAGSLLGFGLYMLSRSDVKLLQALAKGIAKVYSRIVAGTPVVVILMILFYVVFGKFRDMNGVVVAIIGFTLTFGAFVYDHMTVSVSSVDYGQTEAAYALGYTKNKTFFRIIFPQAMSIFLPSYCGQAVEVIKATAVVGYIAVNDLTKMGDIIRSNTYEAFFPLIATAVIYFLLTWALAALLGLLKLRFEPKRRSKEDILKGVNTV